MEKRSRKRPPPSEPSNAVKDSPGATSDRIDIHIKTDDIFLDASIDRAFARSHIKPILEKFAGPTGNIAGARSYLLGMIIWESVSRVEYVKSDGRVHFVVT